MESKKPKPAEKRLPRNSETGEFEVTKTAISGGRKLTGARIIAHHPNGLPVFAASDYGSDVTRAEAQAAVRSVMARRLSGIHAAKN